MHVYGDQYQTAAYYANAVRAHPWTSSTSDSSQQYVDFKVNPDLVPTALEDFAPNAGHPAVQRFFDLLRFINREGGLLETNDCGAKPIGINDKDDGPWPTSRLRSSIRLMVLFRSWEANLSDQFTEALHSSFGSAIHSYPTDVRAVIGLSYVPVVFPDIGEAEGRQLALCGTHFPRFVRQFDQPPISQSVRFVDRTVEVES